jgi:hypothetical protein
MTPRRGSAGGHGASAQGVVVWALRVEVLGLIP